MALTGRYYEFSFSLGRADRLCLYNTINRSPGANGLLHSYLGDESLVVVVPDTSALFEGVTAEILVRSWFDVANVKWVTPHQTLIIDGQALEAHLQRVKAVTPLASTRDSLTDAA